MSMRNSFIKTLCDLLKIDSRNVLTLKTINDMTKHVKEERFIEFISKCAETHEYKKPIEVIKSVADSYMQEIKSELFANVEQEAQEFEKKLEYFFFLVDERFRRYSSHYDENFAKEHSNPENFIKKGAKIPEELFNEKEVYLIKQNGFLGYFYAINDPYRDCKKIIENQIKNILTKKYLLKEQKEIENKPKIDLKLTYKKI